MEQLVLNPTDVDEALDTLEFSCIFDTYYKRVYNYIFYRVSNKSDTEDLTSQVFEKAMLRIGTYVKAKSPFEVWLFAIARNVVNDHFRSQKRFWFFPLENFENSLTSTSNPEEAFLENEINSQLRYALARLSGKERNLVALKFGADLKNTEIAKLLGCTDSNIGIQLFRIMKKLKAELGGTR